MRNSQPGVTAQAPAKSAKRADAMRSMGDLAGRAVWLRIKRAWEGLLAEKPKGAVHWGSPNYLEITRSATGR